MVLLFFPQNIQLPGISEKGICRRRVWAIIYKYKKYNYPQKMERYPQFLRKIGKPLKISGM
jgi:hypothetical protein